MTHPVEQSERPAATLEERLERRSTWMIRTGGLGLIAAYLIVTGGSAVGFLIGLLAVALFVGGLVVRP